MAEQSPQQVRALFEQVADLPPAEQRAMLDDCCAGNPELRARVEYLLACDAWMRAGEGVAALLDGPLVRTPRRGASSAERTQVTRVTAEAWRSFCTIRRTFAVTRPRRGGRSSRARA
jgi:hypothetical protein